jgi:hypothetical protein
MVVLELICLYVFDIYNVDLRKQFDCEYFTDEKKQSSDDSVDSFLASSFLLFFALFLLLLEIARKESHERNSEITKTVLV